MLLKEKSALGGLLIPESDRKTFWKVLGGRREEQ